MAGISLAWLLDGLYDVVVFESGPTPGGNIQGVPVELDGFAFEVDLGAQFFHPGPYPAYIKLLEALGLYPTPAETHSFPASITLGSAVTGQPLFVSPIIPDRLWPVFAQWNLAGLEAFNTTFQAAKQREEADGDYKTTLEEWLPTLGLSRFQWEGMILPWAASLFSGSIQETRGLSARAAMVFAAKALPDQAADPLLYYVLRRGLTEAIRRMTDQFTSVETLTQSRVQRVSRQPGGFLVEADGAQSRVVDQIVFACSGPATLQLLADVAGTWGQRAALQGIAFRPAHLVLHTDPHNAPSVQTTWSFLNSAVYGDACEASMWMADVVSSVPRQTAAKLWKSWAGIAIRQPKDILAERFFRHMHPTPATLAAQEKLASLQGQGGVWIAGGYTRPYDSQETALLSALQVALGLGVASQRAAGLNQA